MTTVGNNKTAFVSVNGRRKVVTGGECGVSGAFIYLPPPPLFLDEKGLANLSADVQYLISTKL